MAVSLASTIAAVLSRSNITTVDEFATAVDLSPGFVVNIFRNENIQAQAQCLFTDTCMVTDATSTQSVGTQAAIAAHDMVDTITAEAMVAEALCMMDEAEKRAQLAAMDARVWFDRAQLATTLLRRAEERCDVLQVV